MLDFKGMPNLIGFYKGIILPVISVQIIISCLKQPQNCHKRNQNSVKFG